MNRNLLIIAAASLSLIVAAPVQSKDQTLRLPVQTQNGSRCVSTLSQSLRMTDGRLAHLPYAGSKTPCVRVPQGPGADDKLITEIPEGDTRTMVRYGMAYGYSWFTGLISEPLDGSVHDITIEENGDVYMQYPISFFFQGQNNYIKGHLDGNVITIQLPQLINIEELHDDDGNVTETYYDYALKLEFRPSEEDGDTGWYYACEDQIYQFRLNDDGTLTSLTPDYMIGQCNWMESDTNPGIFGWSWQGNGDFVDKELILEDKELEVPSEAEFESWTLVDGFNARTLPVAFLNDKVYIKEIFTDQGAQGAIVGSMNGDKITFDSDQYLGISLMNMHTAYFMGGHIEKVEVEGLEYDNFVNDGSLVLDYDRDRKVMNTESGAFSITSSDKKMWYTMTNHPYISVPNPNAVVTRLYPPRIDTFYPAEDDYEAEMLFAVSAVDPDKNILDPERYFFELIMDDEVFTFCSDEYELPEGMTEMTEVPVNYISDNAYDFYAYGTNHGIVIYPQGYENLGIRTLYKGDSTVYSDITWAPGYESGVKDWAEDSKETEVRYYTIDGIPAVTHEHGLFIRVAKCQDGTMRRSKIAIAQ